MNTSPKGITEKEWQELVGLEYVLTWRYSTNESKDEKRYKKLSAKKWNFGFAFDTNEYYKKLCQ